MQSEHMDTYGNLSWLKSYQKIQQPFCQSQQHKPSLLQDQHKTTSTLDGWRMTGSVGLLSGTAKQPRLHLSASQDCNTIKTRGKTSSARGKFKREMRYIPCREKKSCAQCYSEEHNTCVPFRSLRCHLLVLCIGKCPLDKSYTSEH